MIKIDKESSIIILGVDENCLLVCISASTGKLYNNGFVDNGLRCNSATDDRCYNGSCIVGKLYYIYSV